MEQIELKNIHEQICKTIEGQKSEGERFTLSRNQILNPKGAYEHLYAILFKFTYLKRQVYEYNRIFMYNEEDNMSKKRHEKKLSQFNEGLKFTKPKVFQDALYHNIIMNLHLIIDLIRDFCIKYKKEYILNIDEKWLVNKSPNGKAEFNKFCYKKYKLSRQLRNNFYAHEGLSSIEEDDNMLFGYNKLVGIIQNLCNYDKNLYAEVVENTKDKIDCSDLFFELYIDR